MDQRGGEVDGGYKRKGPEGGPTGAEVTDQYRLDLKQVFRAKDTILGHLEIGR
jgi:hypothetical protein